MTPADANLDMLELDVLNVVKVTLVPFVTYALMAITWSKGSVMVDLKRICLLFI